MIRQEIAVPGTSEIANLGESRGAIAVSNQVRSSKKLTQPKARRRRETLLFSLKITRKEKRDLGYFFFLTFRAVETRCVPEAEASGDNDEAEIGLRDKSLRTTVEHLRHRLSQAEREIVTLKRYRSPQKCQSHETCEILRRDLLAWRDDHEKRINSQIASWQLTEQRQIHDEMENTRMVYDTIQQHLEALERQSARSYFDFRQQIDAWERRFKEDVVSLHDSDLMELREQLKTWYDVLPLTRHRERDKCPLHFFSSFSLPPSYE